MRNHLGQYECRLCLTLHTNEGNYLAHTQGRRHQENLAKRAAREAADAPAAPAPLTRATIKRTVKIGRPGYRVTKQWDAEAGARSLLFEVAYPEIVPATRPRHRFMSAFEQRQESADSAYQYLLFAAEPYETVAFKIPNVEVDRKDAAAFIARWDPDARAYTLQLPFRAGAALPVATAAKGGLPPPPAAGGGAFPPPPPPPGFFGGGAPRPPPGFIPAAGAPAPPRPPPGFVPAPAFR